MRYCSNLCSFLYCSCDLTKIQSRCALIGYNCMPNLISNHQVISMSTLQNCYPEQINFHLTWPWYDSPPLKTSPTLPRTNEWLANTKVSLSQPLCHRSMHSPIEWSCWANMQAQGKAIFCLLPHHRRLSRKTNTKVFYCLIVSDLLINHQLF